MKKFRRNRMIRTMWIPILVLLPWTLVGCGGGGGGGSETAKSAVESSPTPSGGGSVQTAPSGAPTPTEGATSSNEVGGPEVGGVPTLPEGVQVDLGGRRVFLPGLGWLGEDEFWEMYYHQPQRLPTGFDPRELTALGYREDPAMAASSAGKL